MSDKPVKSEADPKVVYADIIDLPHWQSPTRPRMSLYNRAAQFSPFAALTGYEDIIQEEARETGSWVEPGESRKEELSRQLILIADAVSGGLRPVVSFTFFVPDAKKDGGSYTTVTGAVRKIDPVQRRIILMKDDTGLIPEIPIDRITDITLSETFSGLL